jgi:hypothetical protein
MVERGERLLEAAPDRAGARGGKLLTADDGGQAGKSAGPAAERQRSCHREHGGQSRVGLEQARKRRLKIGFAIDADGHFSIIPSMP